LNHGSLFICLGIWRDNISTLVLNSSKLCNGIDPTAAVDELYVILFPWYPLIGLSIDITMTAARAFAGLGGKDSGSVPEIEFPSLA
jgi:hypothetical protein